MKIKGGGDSFTIGQMPPGMSQPSANVGLERLLAACRELEQTTFPLRPPSSTVVVNRNAQFEPHTDSGAGHGPYLPPTFHTAVPALGLL
jgi:hypothetical protein